MTYQPRRPTRSADAAVTALFRVAGAALFGVTLAVIYFAVLMLP